MVHRYFKVYQFAGIEKLVQYRNTFIMVYCSAQCMVIVIGV